MNSKEIQYYHYKYANVYNIKGDKQYTVVCYVPTNQELRTLVLAHTMDMPGEILLKIGHTKVHKKDQYCYKIGREKSLKHVTTQGFKILAMNFTNDGIINYTLQSESYRITVQTKPGRKTPYLLGATFW